MSMLHVNGRDHTVDTDTGTPILRALREAVPQAELVMDKFKD